MDGTILIADDDRTIRTVLTQAFTRAGCKVHATASLLTLKRWIVEGKGDLVVSDVMMPDGNGIEFLPKIHEVRPDMPVIVISAQNTILTTVQATGANAYDFLPKPFDLPDLMAKAAQALQTKARQAAATQPVLDTPEVIPLVGRDDKMQALFRTIAQVMNAPLPVVVEGESGVGKTLIAKTIHQLSDRNMHPLITCTPLDIPDPAALQARAKSAKSGTLVVEDIVDLPLPVQNQLSVLLENSDDNSPRIIATSRQPLVTAFANSALRDDLYYRITGLVLTVPPLRDRVGDIPLMVDRFLTADDVTVTDDAMAFLRAAPWPGNVRELQNLLRRAMLTGAGQVITGDHLRAATQAQITPDGVPDLLSTSVHRHLSRYFAMHEAELPPVGVYQRILREVEKPMIEIAMAATAGNQAKCAELLGINRNTLRKKLTELEIHVTRRRKLM